MSLVEYPYAGLILPDATHLDPEPYLTSAEQVLNRIDPVPGGRAHRSAHGNKVFGRRFGIIVVSEEDSDYGPRVIIEAVTADGDVPEDERAARLLSDVVLACLEHSDADILEWYSPDVLLDREDFIRLRSYVSPKRLVDMDEDMEDELFEADMLHDIERDSVTETVYGRPGPVPESERPKTTDRLAKYKIRLEAQEPQQRRLSVAGFLIAGVIGIISLPVAVFVYIVTLGRGMDFRLISQALVVTALFTALYNADRLGGVLNGIMH